MEEVIFESTLSQPDYKKVFYFNVFLRKPLMLILTCLIFVLGVISLILPTFFQISKVFSVIFIVYPLFLIFMSSRRIEKTIKAKQKEGIEPQKMIVSDNGIVSIKPSKRGMYEWNHISNFYETKDYFLAYTDDNKILAFPKRDANSDECFAMRNLIINHMSYKKYRLKR